MKHRELCSVLLFKKIVMADLLYDQTNKALISMSLPISIGMLSIFLFQVVDTYFVGQLGANALAALSFASTVYFLMVGLFRTAKFN